MESESPLNRSGKKERQNYDLFAGIQKIKPNCFERNICRSDNFRCGSTFVQFITLQFHRLVCKVVFDTNAGNVVKRS